MPNCWNNLFAFVRDSNPSKLCNPSDCHLSCITPSYIVVFLCQVSCCSSFYESNFWLENRKLQNKIICTCTVCIIRPLNDQAISGIVI